MDGVAPYRAAGRYRVVRALSTKEAAVIQTLLADVPGSERDRMARAPASRSGYMSIRRKAVQEGWLKLRYIPDLRLVPSDGIHFALARPYADRWREAVAALRSEPRTVHLAVAPELLLAVRWLGEGEAAPEGPPGPPGELFSQWWGVRAAPATGGLPIYFDFEGAWTRWASLAAPISYPWSLAGGAPDDAPSNGGAKGREGKRRAARKILDLPVPGADEEGRMAFSPAYLKARERSVVDDRWLVRRMMPDFRRIPPLGDRRVLEYLFITGRRRPDRPARQLLDELVARAGVTPFLFAFDEERTLVGLLAPRPETRDAPGESPIEVLARHLARIESGVQRVASTVWPVDHEYRGLFGPG